MFCHVSSEQVVGVHDVSSVYHVPLLLQSQRIVEYLTKRLKLDEVYRMPVIGRRVKGVIGGEVNGTATPASVSGESDTESEKAVKEEIKRVWAERKAKGAELGKRWKELTAGQERLFDTVTIALVGKYTDLKDSYMSVTKALEHSAFRVHRKLTIHWVESSDLEPETQETNPKRYHDAWRAVVGANGILVPGGFGHRGTEGMMLAIKYAREQKVPFLGICLGFQLAVIEWARNVLDIPSATSAEFHHAQPEHPLIVFMPEISRTHMGGTMRLGLRPTVFEEGTEGWCKIRKLYGGKGKIWERHRHRYEVNPEYVQRLVKSGMLFVGKDEKGERMQVCELKDHPFFVGLQAHPEFCTRPLNPSPAFLGFVAASCGAEVLTEQIELQLKTFKPPHPEGAMISEAQLRSASDANVRSATGGVEESKTDDKDKGDAASLHMEVVQAVNEDV
ncbi:hypothetical protein CVT26_011425 [Gymnopilus dilepis]|uniref:CTP synthase n=1 Tax=Gymnopilus dilepis TaxID=231916 RepID=A0A409X4G4_9AGAR|nr:hypothetical protein CVT26_011425 [Gymnopilus dilepis]